MRDYVVFYLNGRERRVSGSDVFLTVSTWLRRVELATGTKVVCEEGDCGACTVLVGRGNGDSLRYVALNSCIQIVAQLDGAHVVTVEGLAEPGQLSRVQQTMVDLHGAQCGYCTPGFVVAMTALVEERSSWTTGDVRDALTGNLCRCTGYVSIIEAAMAAAAGAPRRLRELYGDDAIASRLNVLCSESVAVGADAREFFAPATLAEALEVKSGRQSVVVLQGGTDLGVLANKRGIAPAVLLSLGRVRELDGIDLRDGELVVGANATLTDFERAVEPLIPELHRILRLFGSPQIRNAGTVAGNIANGSPIADLLPFLFVSGTRLELTSVRGTRQVDINHFYRGYKTLDLAADELITRVFVPLPNEGETVRLYKVSKRRDLDISAFTAAFRLRLRERRMSDVRVAFGGVAPTVIRMPKLEAILESSELSEETFRRAGEEARLEIRPITDVRGSADFRLQLAENILMKFFFDVTPSGS